MVTNISLTSEDKANGIVSSTLIPFNELTDEDLKCMFEYNADGPGFVLKIRPDWIKKYHPEMVN